MTKKKIVQSGGYAITRAMVKPEVFADLPNGSGRIHKPDARDRKFRMATIADVAMITAPNMPERKYYASQWWGYQGITGTCTAYGALNFLHDGPVTHPKLKKPAFDPFALYQEIRKADGFPEDPSLQQGATTRGIGEHFRALGIVSAYHWATPDDPQRAVEEIDICVRSGAGPVLIGTDWLSGMFTPDAYGFIHPQGDPVGGHLWVITGSNSKMRKFRGECAWSKTGPWYFFIDFDAVAQLLAGFQYPGEAMIAVENRDWKP